jgi:hypothetical protein
VERLLIQQSICRQHVAQCYNAKRSPWTSWNENGMQYGDMYDVGMWSNWQVFLRTTLCQRVMYTYIIDSTWLNRNRRCCVTCSCHATSLKRWLPRGRKGVYSQNCHCSEILLIVHKNLPLWSVSSPTTLVKNWCFAPRAGSLFDGSQNASPQACVLTPRNVFVFWRLEVVDHTMEHLHEHCCMVILLVYLTNGRLHETLHKCSFASNPHILWDKPSN